MATLLTHPSGMTVELLNHMNDDLAVVNAARVSYGKETEYEKYCYDMATERFVKLPPFDAPYNNWRHNHSVEWIECLSAKDAGLLNYLMRERHGTPFEMVQLYFRVHAPIKVIWEWVRHRIASYNIMSTRYVDWDKDYYIPQAEAWRTQIGKVGHYKHVPITDGSEHHISALYEKAMEEAFNYYGILVDMGLAREVAANLLPMGSMTTMMWSINLRSLFNFLSLRTADNALLEIRECANMVEDLAEQILPESFNAWHRYGRPHP